MSIPVIETHQIEDLSILDPVNEFISQTDWYCLAKRPSGPQNPESLKAAPTVVVKSIIDPVTGTWPFQVDVPRDEFGFIPRNHTLKTTSIMRQGYGWDDASTARRAPVIYAFFQYLNSTFFNNSFTLDGVPEEVSGSRHLWYDESEREHIPGWGTDVGPSGRADDELEPTPVWTAYANAKTPATTRLALKNNRGLSNGAHRDWYGTHDTPESEADGLYTLLVNMNPTWKYSNGVELVFHETLPPSDDVGVHNRRGYGVGRPTHIFGHTPGLVILYPASAIHTTTSPGAQDAFLASKVAFRVKRKPQ